MLERTLQIDVRPDVDAGLARLVVQLGAEPEFLAVWLPAGVISGAGFGLLVISHTTDAAANGCPGRSFPKRSPGQSDLASPTPRHRS